MDNIAYRTCKKHGSVRTMHMDQHRIAMHRSGFLPSCQRSGQLMVPASMISKSVQWEQWMRNVTSRGYAEASSHHQNAGRSPEGVLGTRSQTVFAFCHPRLALGQHSLELLFPCKPRIDKTAGSPGAVAGLRSEDPDTMQPRNVNVSSGLLSLWKHCNRPNIWPRDLLGFGRLEIVAVAIQTQIF